MADKAKARTVAALEQMIEDMQFLVDNPRMQQRRWVAKGKEWLPTLHNAVEDLQQDVSQQDFVLESYQSLLAVFEHIGLQIEKRDETTWGYRWHDGVLKGTHPSRTAALEAALRERLK